jgi:cell pole-organizing protein PopZ
MEEILASIRRIISDDPPETAATPPAKPEKAEKPVKAKAEAAKPKAEPAAGEAMSQDDLDKLFAADEAAAEPEPAPEPEAEEEVLDLAAMAVVEKPIHLVEGLKPDESDLDFVEPEKAEPEDDEMDMAAAMAEEQAPPPPPRPAAKAEARAAPEEHLVSDTTGASVNAAFGQLSHTILAANAKTLDDLVKEMLRPMLRGWLDENLPAIVERLVRAEIERVSRGR